jgi:hypothetical protein
MARFLGLEQANPRGTRSAAAQGTRSALATPEDAALLAAQTGLPVFNGRPADPMLDLIDPPRPPAGPTTTATP